MQRSGYEVHVARDGEEALRLIESVGPDLVLLDVMMPLRSGYEVCQRIRERAGLAPHQDRHAVGQGPRRRGRRGLALGADPYVTKPFSTRDLMGKIEGLLERRDATASWWVQCAAAAASAVRKSRA